MVHSIIDIKYNSFLTLAQASVVPIKGQSIINHQLKIGPKERRRRKKPKAYSSKSMSSHQLNQSAIQLDPRPKVLPVLTSPQHQNRLISLESIPLRLPSPHKRIGKRDTHARNRIKPTSIIAHMEKTSTAKHLRNQCLNICNTDTLTLWQVERLPMVRGLGIPVVNAIGEV